jgi:hypothetical protein
MDDAKSSVLLAPDATDHAASRDRDLLRQFLDGRNVRCARCFYNLRDLAGDKCPECGQHLALRLSAAEPRLAAVFADVVGLSMGVDPCAIFVFGWIHDAISFRSYPEVFVSYVSLAASVAATIVSVLILFVWIRSWRWIAIQSWPLQRLLAALCWAYAVAIVSLVFWLE